jgi:hypothetical protein
MREPWTEIWKFETAHCAVVFCVTPEEDDPAGHFEDDAIVAAIRSGDLAWFTARVTVEKHGIEIGADYLGGCAYDSPEDFCTGENRGGYFRDMVREAVSDARANLARLCAGH